MTFFNRYGHAAPLDGPGNRLFTTIRFMRDPYTCYRDWKQKYGDTFLIKALNGNVVSTCNTENIRRIFACNSQAVGQFAVDTIKPLMGDSSVILSSGEEHRKQRAVLSPCFYGERIDGKASEIHEIALRTGSEWCKGESVRMMDPTLEISLEVIIRIVFGVQSPDRIKTYKAAVKEFVSSFHPALGFSQLLQRPLFGLSPWNRFVKARRVLYELLDEDIQNSGCPHAKTSVVEKLAEHRDAEGNRWSQSMIRSQLVTLLLAGHETTQIAMAWAMSWLHRSPDYLERLRIELTECSTIEEMIASPFLEGVCNEALRLNSVVSDLVRAVRQPLELEELTLEAGSNVGVAICLVHEDPEIYPEPMQFNPERWLKRKPKPFEFMPFGGGIRRCPGATLALLEMKVVIATWIRNFVFELPPDAPESEATYRRNITMAPVSGIPLVYRGRTRS